MPVSDWAFFEVASLTGISQRRGKDMARLLKEFSQSIPPHSLLGYPDMVIDIPGFWTTTHALANDGYGLAVRSGVKRRRYSYNPEEKIAFTYVRFYQWANSRSTKHAHVNMKFGFWSESIEAVFAQWKHLSVTNPGSYYTTMGMKLNIRHNGESWKYLGIKEVLKQFSITDILAEYNRQNENVLLKEQPKLPPDMSNVINIDDWKLRDLGKDYEDGIAALRSMAAQMK